MNKKTVARHVWTHGINWTVQITRFGVTRCHQIKTLERWNMLSRILAVHREAGICTERWNPKTMAMPTYWYATKLTHAETVAAMDAAWASQPKVNHIMRFRYTPSKEAQALHPEKVVEDREFAKRYEVQP